MTDATIIDFSQATEQASIDELRARTVERALERAAQEFQKAQRKVHLFEELRTSALPLIRSWQEDPSRCWIYIADERMIHLQTECQTIADARDLFSLIDDGGCLLWLQLGFSHDGSSPRIEPAIDAAMRKQYYKGDDLLEREHPSPTEPGWHELQENIYIESQRLNGYETETYAIAYFQDRFSCDRYRIKIKILQPAIEITRDQLRWLDDEERGKFPHHVFGYSSEGMIGSWTLASPARLG